MEGLVKQNMDFNEEQMQGRLHRKGHTALTACHTETFDPANVDDMINELMKAKAKMKSVGPIYKFCLSPQGVISKLTELAESNSTARAFPMLGPIYGMTFVPLDGLEEKVLMFETRESLNNFLDIVESNKTINLLSPKKAVEEAIKLYEFIGKMKKGETKVEDFKDGQ